MLWHKSLVMYDIETRSLWSHILGVAKLGAFTGKRLKRLDAVMTDWKSWLRAHPDTTVAMLSRMTQDYDTKYYAQPLGWVIGLADDERAKAWSFKTLGEQPILIDKWREKPIVVMYDRNSATARVYCSEVDGRKLSFEMIATNNDGPVINDKQTRSTWNLVSGTATAGPMKGRRLEPLPAIVSFMHTWLQFYPHTERK